MQVLSFILPFLVILSALGRFTVQATPASTA